MEFELKLFPQVFLNLFKVRRLLDHFPLNPGLGFPGCVLWVNVLLKDKIMIKLKIFVGDAEVLGQKSPDRLYCPSSC